MAQSLGGAAIAGRMKDAAAADAAKIVARDLQIMLLS